MSTQLRDNSLYTVGKPKPLITKWKWRDEWMDRWMNEWIDKWMDGC